LKRWIKSANFAIEGILHGARTQRHLRYHLYSAAGILILCYALGISRNDFLVIAITVIVVLVAELFNTAIETMVDILSPEHSEKARIAKDVAAGAVLTTAFGAAVIGYIILSPYIRKGFQTGFRIAKHSGEDISIMAVILVLILAIIINVVIVYVVLKLTRRIEQLLGVGGIAILKKVFGIILLAIAIKLFTSNLQALM